jgi:3-oxoacyl-[acyl-carrier protein] reductase
MPRQFPDLQGKTAVVTGASTGIGLAISRRLVDEGVNVFAIGRDRQALKRLKRETSGAGRFDFEIADLRYSANIEAAIGTFERTYRAADILVNVAGVWHDEKRAFFGSELSEIADTEIADVLGVGVQGALMLTKRVIATMKPLRRGKVIFISCGFAGSQEAKGWLHYYVANKATEAATEGLAAEVRAYGIQVNCIAPWYVATDSLKRFFPEKVETALDPADVASMAAMLSSSMADHMSGQVYVLRERKDA